MTKTETFPRYDITRDYRSNYDHAPDPVDVDVPPMPGEWTFLGRSVASPLGMPAGPLLNGPGATLTLLRDVSMAPA